jgi:hypothetical protein
VIKGGPMDKDIYNAHEDTVRLSTVEVQLTITHSYSLLTIQYYNCNYLFQWDRLELFLEQAAGMEAPDTDGIISDVLKRHGVKRPIDVVILEVCRLLAMSDVEAYEEVLPVLTFGS